MKYTINKDPKGPLYITEEEMKLNYNCPADQKTGSGPGSCGGANGEKASGSSKESEANEGLNPNPHAPIKIRQFATVNLGDGSKGIVISTKMARNERDKKVPIYTVRLDNDDIVEVEELDIEDVTGRKVPSGDEFKKLVPLYLRR